MGRHFRLDAIGYAQRGQEACYEALLYSGVDSSVGCWLFAKPRSAGGGNYSLSWYPREGTDYGPLIPGFKSLAMCRRAGVGMTLERLIERFGTSSEVSEQRQGSKGASS